MATDLAEVQPEERSASMQNTQVQDAQQYCEATVERDVPGAGNLLSGPNWDGRWGQYDTRTHQV